MAYALQSLIQILEQILLPKHQNRIIQHDQKPHIESLHEKVVTLEDLLRRSSLMSKKHLEKLECQIRDAAYKAEDIIESYTAGLTSTLSSQELQNVIDEFDSATATVLNFADRDRMKEELNTIAPPMRADRSPKDFLVGVDDDLTQLKYRLTGHQTKLEIIPIVGMGGLGKTTLARKVYDDPLVISHFDVCAWATVSQDYNVRAVLLGLLQCIIGEQNVELIRNENDNLLADRLYQSLFGRRYLVVLDDMWSSEVWNYIQKFLPDNNNNSRIMLTTREIDVANYADPGCNYHQMHLLDQIHGWELLKRTVFAQECCPPELQPIGVRIADNCGGLPLAITVIGGLLSSRKNQLFWEEVSSDTSSIIADKHEFSNVFSFSYKHLPSHLKPCFLYFGAFPEDSDIRASHLIKLWVAEGFLQPIKHKSLEEAARIYLKSLVDRNLISVRRQLSHTRVESYGIHDLLRNLCVRKAIEEKFLKFKDSRAKNITEDDVTLRRMSFNSCLVFENIDRELLPFTRSFLCFGRQCGKSLGKLCFTARLIRVIDLLHHDFHLFPEEILQLTNLRYLAMQCTKGLPSSISRLTYLQTLIVFLGISYTSENYVPSELWEIACLRHVVFLGLSDDTYKLISVDADVHGLVLENLQTLSNVEITQKTLESFPNLKTLRIGFRCMEETATDFTRLDKLESLILQCLHPIMREILSDYYRFPPSLKKVNVTVCQIHGGFMSKLASLPNLEVLKLRNCRYIFEVNWEVSEGGFPQLQYLLLDSMDKLEEWTVEDDSPFPRLQRLVIRKCRHLRGLPASIGEAPSLQLIEVDKDSPDAAASAKRILEEQHENGNYVLQLRT